MRRNGALPSGEAEQFKQLGGRAVRSCSGRILKRRGQLLYRLLLIFVEIVPACAFLFDQTLDLQTGNNTHATF